MQTLCHKINKDHYYEYHEDHGHRTDDYNDLKREIEMCVQNGKVSRFMKDVRKTDYRGDQEDNRGRDKQYERSQSPKDRRQDYNWQRGERDEEKREYHSQRPNEKVIGEILKIGGGLAGGSSDLAKRVGCKRMPESGYPSKYFQPGVAITFSSKDMIPIGTWRLTP